MDGGTTEITGEGSRTIVEGLGSLEGWWNASGIVLWTFVLFGAFVLNATLLLAFVKRPGLRTISNRFVMNLTVSNLLTCAILNPLLMLDGPSSSESRSTVCSIAEGATAFVTSSSIFSVLLIAIDQYLAVVDPLRYRTRIDKLKCGILVISVWFVSLIFSILAGLNPSPQSLWLVCAKREMEATFLNNGNYTRDETLNLTIDENFRMLVNTTDNINNNLENDLTFTEVEENVNFWENTTELLEETFVENFISSSSTNATEFLSKNITITYGMIYAIAYGLFVYLVPFIGVCWIYVSIYSAAHKNSERTRRTGSRPILSSASFSEEYYPVRQEVPSEDCRRIPKISSLSSIDESIETHTPSQTMMMPRRDSELIANANYQPEATGMTIEEEEPISVVFTVGESKVAVTSKQRTSSINDTITNAEKTKDTINDNKVPTAVLKAQFLDSKETARARDDLVKSKFRDEPQQKRKSSHDLMYEEMLRNDLEKLRLRDRSNEIASSEDEDDNNDNDNDIDDDDEDVNKDYGETNRLNNKTFAMSHGETETDKICDSKNVINTYTKKSVMKDGVENETIEIQDIDCDKRTSNNEEPDIIRDNETSVSNDDSSSRKNSLDFSISNLPTQSSILKNQNTFFGGKMSSRNTTGFHRNEQSSQSFHYDENLYVRNSTGNFDTHVFGATNTNNNNNTPIVTITPPNKSCLQRVSSVRSTSSYINSLKHRISNGSLFKYREETRAARISALVIVMGLICWTPYVIVLILKNLASITGELINHESNVAAMSFIILATYVSPLLFGYRSRRVKRELRKFFCFRRELSYKNNRSLMAKKVLKRRQSGNLSQLEMDARYNIFNCVYGKTKWPKDKVHFVQVPETALVVETCRSSFSSGASTQISSTSTEEC